MTHLRKERMRDVSGPIMWLEGFRERLRDVKGGNGVVLPRGMKCITLPKTSSAFGVTIFSFKCGNMGSLPSSSELWLPEGTQPHLGRRQRIPVVMQCYRAHRCQTAASLPSHLPRRSESMSRSRATTRRPPSHWRSSSPSGRRSSRVAWWAKSTLQTETRRTR